MLNHCYLDFPGPQDSVISLAASITTWFGSLQSVVFVMMASCPSSSQVGNLRPVHPKSRLKTTHSSRNPKFPGSEDLYGSPVQASPVRPRLLTSHQIHVYFFTLNKKVYVHTRVHKSYSIHSGLPTPAARQVTVPATRFGETFNF